MATETTLTEESIVAALVQILRESKGVATVASVVLSLYKVDARHKDFVKNELGTTAIDLLARHPKHFALDDARHVVALSANEDSVHVYSMEEIARHNHKEDAVLSCKLHFVATEHAAGCDCCGTDADMQPMQWIVVNGDVYDITDFVRTHWGWNSAGKNSTIIAIMSALGSDCTADFEDVHHGLAMWPTIKAQLEGFYIGRVRPPYQGDGARVPYYTWDQLVSMGRIPQDIMPVKLPDGTWESRQFSSQGGEEGR